MAIATRPADPPPPAAHAAGQHLWQRMLAIAERRRKLARARQGAPARPVGPLADGHDDGHDGELARGLTATLAEAETCALDTDTRELLALYRPLLTAPPGTRYVSAHLGQSIDGHIATPDGRSYGLNDDRNLDHLHRMRALSDAIVVGAGTVIADDPQLTTRRVSGRNPVRVVLDGRGRIDARYRLCQDGAAPTLILSGRAQAAGRIGRAEVIPLPRDGEGRPDVNTALTRLGERGLHVLFVEGGGITVSRLLQAGLLDRLHITIAPVLFGSGVRGLSLDGIGCVDEALRPPVRQFALGLDLLWDFALIRPDSP